MLRILPIQPQSVFWRYSRFLVKYNSQKIGILVSWNHDRTEVTVFAGEKIPRHMSRLVHSNDPDIIYLVDYNSISRYNLKTGETEQTLETSYNDWERRNTFLSPDGKYLVRISDNVAHLLDPVNLSTIRSISLTRFFDNSNYLRIVNVTSNGWMSVIRDEWPYCRRYHRFRER